MSKSLVDYLVCSLDLSVLAWVRFKLSSSFLKSRHLAGDNIEVVNVDISEFANACNRIQLAHVIVQSGGIVGLDYHIGLERVVYVRFPCRILEAVLIRHHRFWGWVSLHHSCFNHTIMLVFLWPYMQVEPRLLSHDAVDDAALVRIFIWRSQGLWVTS